MSRFFYQLQHHELNLACLSWKRENISRSSKVRQWLHLKDLTYSHCDRETKSSDTEVLQEYPVLGSFNYVKMRKQLNWKLNT